MNDEQLRSSIILFISAVLGFFPAAGLLTYCGDINGQYSGLFFIKIIVAIIIACMSIIGIIDLFGLSKKHKEAMDAKAFAAGLGLGMTIFQILAFAVNSDCFKNSGPLPLPFP